ncbi:MAG: hypothetical protein KZQ78_04900 [Candidatus Thiodiazotropha sp. (ex Ustalcina ferruginea)]|nr:hypothetical protein [Candidatus Thiodiazotropha sp. (ex Ustalcina ferruginea)]
MLQELKKDGESFDIEINIGAKQIHRNWFFTGVCRHYRDEIAVLEQTKQGEQDKSNGETDISDDLV